MRTDTKDIVCRVAYLIGIKKPTLVSSYSGEYSELIKQLEADKEATVIRYLCKLRTSLMLKFKRTDDILRNDYINIDKIQWFDTENIAWLEEQGIQIILPNKLAADYSLHINKLIAEHINGCRRLFPDWLNWEYIKDLFILPKFTNEENQKYEFEKYMENLPYYPYQQYIHWKPKDYGNILYTDGKFIEILYNMNNDYFGDKSKYKNAVSEIKDNIYDFIRSSYKTVIVVDCENSDVYKLYGMLKNFNGDELDKIDKIVLYDDVHTTDGWDYLERFIGIPVEHIEVERITDYKSLVDIKVSTGVCREFYRNDVSSFILLSSDSDYWGLISSLPEAEFLVVVEWDKCGQAIKRALETSDIYYCSLDDFCSGNIEEFKRAVLIGALKERLPDLLTYNGKELARMLFEQARIEASDTEIMNFYKKYIRTITLKADLDGNFSLDDSLADNSEINYSKVYLYKFSSGLFGVSTDKEDVTSDYAWIEPLSIYAQNNDIQLPQEMLFSTVTRDIYDDYGNYIETETVEYLLEIESNSSGISTFSLGNSTESQTLRINARTHEINVL